VLTLLSSNVSSAILINKLVAGVQLGREAAAQLYLWAASSIQPDNMLIAMTTFVFSTGFSE
jgi:hypothetical protein